MEVICIDGNFSSEQLYFYNVNGIIVPKKDNLYNIRDIIKNSVGTIGLLLEEILNPTVTIKHPILGISNMEPNWNINRFRKLNGECFFYDEVKELLKNVKELKNN
jgi:hypothetical protein